MLLNEFLKEHRKVEKLEAALNAVNQHLSAQDAEIREVRAEIELSKPRTANSAERVLGGHLREAK